MVFDLKKFGGNIAVISETDVRTYDQLSEAANEIADAVGERCLVFLFCTNSMPSIAGYVGFLNRGIVPLMLDSDLNAELVSNLLKLYRPKYLWLPARLSDGYAECKEIFRLQDYVLLDMQEADPFDLNDGLALLMTTSGSTGSPKFVRQSYENIVANTKSIVEYLRIDEWERAITNLPMSYVFGLSIINTHLYVGASVVATDKTMFQKEFWQLLKDHEVTSLSGVPYTFSMLQRLRFFRMQLPALKTITQAGGKLDPELHLQFAEYASKVGKKFYVMYGAAEATARMGYLPAEDSLRKCGSMGMAIPGGRFELIDNDGRLIDGADVIGELIYYGDNVSWGYAEGGADLIKGDERGKRLETGDLAKRDDEGYYTIVGRKKRFLKMFGKRINLQEVEHLIRNKFGIAEVACAGVDDKMYVFVVDDDRLDEIAAYSSRTINVHPTALKVKFIDEIPKNASGKVLYNELERYY